MPLDTAATSLAPSNTVRMPDRLGLRKLEFALRAVGVLAKANLRIYREEIARRLMRRESNHDGVTRDFSVEADDLWRSHKQLILRISGKFPKLSPDERGIIISNHPNDDELFSWLHVVTDEFSPDVIAIMKDEFLTKPYLMPLGWPAYLGGMGVPIDREKGASALNTIRESCETIFTPGKAMIIFADGTHPKHDRIAASQEKIMAARPDLNVKDWMHYTPFPRSGGLMRMLKATHDYPVRILNTTVGLSADSERDNVRGATVHVYGEEVRREELMGEVPDEKSEKAALNEWLIEEWKRKNKMLGGWRQGVENILETD